MDPRIDANSQSISWLAKIGNYISRSISNLWSNTVQSLGNFFCKRKIDNCRAVPQQSLENRTEAESTKDSFESRRGILVPNDKTQAIIALSQTNPIQALQKLAEATRTIEPTSQKAAYAKSVIEKFDATNSNFTLEDKQSMIALCSARIYFTQLLENTTTAPGLHKKEMLLALAPLSTFFPQSL